MERGICPRYSIDIPTLQVPPPTPKIHECHGNRDHLETENDNFIFQPVFSGKCEFSGDFRGVTRLVVLQTSFFICSFCGGGSMTSNWMNPRIQALPMDGVFFSGQAQPYTHQPGGLRSWWWWCGLMTREKKWLMSSVSCRLLWIYFWLFGYANQLLLLPIWTEAVQIGKRPIASQLGFVS